MEKLIEIKNLSKKFGNFILFDNLNLTINKGEKIALCGSNGCGKTTLIELILGITKKNKGKINVNVKNEDIGIQFQDSNFPEGLTTREIVIFFNKLNNKNVPDEKIKKIVTRYRMDDFWNRSAHSLSGGQKQKLNILLASINSPELLILDEISTGLDITTKNMILKSLKDQIESEKCSLILVSHDETEIENLTNRFIFIFDKKIVYDKPTKEVIKEFTTIKNAFYMIEKKYKTEKN